MSRISWSRLALRDLSNIQNHYTDVAPDFHDRVETSVLTAARFLLATPGAGTPFGSRNARKWSIRGATYVMIYRPHPQGIEILRIHHARENWRMM